MKRTSGLPGTLLFLLLLGACFGYVFLFKKQERRYDEILIDVPPGRDASAVHRLAQEHGFRLRPHAFVVGPNEFTRKHRILSVYKYDVDPAKLNTVLASLQELAGAGVVRAVEPNYRVRAFGPVKVDDPLFAHQWNLKKLRVDELWKRADGSGVVVAVIDTGVSRKLPDLSASRLTKGWNFVAGNDDFEDDNGHGSHVAGTIAQDTGNGVGVAGVAPRAKIMPLKVLNRRGSGSTLAIAEAIVYAADKGAHVINLSLGGGGYSQVLRDACDYARQKGVLVVAAAGNSSQPAADYPARYDGVLAVAAANERGRLAGYSNHGEGVDLIAPGGETSGSPRGGILQNAPAFLGDGAPFEESGGGRYYFFQGTSMAAPHVAGVAALLHQSGVRDPEALRSLLVGSAAERVEGLPYLDAVAALGQSRAGVPAAPPKAAPRRPRIDEQRLNAGAVATSPVTSGVVLAIALAAAVLFQLLRKKAHAMERMFTPLFFGGLVLGATGLSFLGFLQEQFPFTVLPERFAGLLFNSVLDYDRVLFFLNEPSPLWHNFLVPAGFMVLLNFADEAKRRFTIGLLLGFAAKLFCEGVFVRELALLPDGAVAAAFLIVSALVTFVFPFVMAKR